MTENEIGDRIVTESIRLHREIGPGLLESVYRITLSHRLRSLGLNTEEEVSIPIQIDGITLEQGFRADIIVNDKVLIELKSQENVLPVHKKQVLTYLKLSNLKLGYLINFGDELLKNGLTRFINGTL